MTEEERAIMMQQMQAQQAEMQKLQQAATATTSSETDGDEMPEGWENTGRNDPCPCGSGSKFKHCHGRLA